MILAEVIRSGFPESCHRGSVVVLGPDGRAVLRAGETTAAAFPRSANKPMQAVGMLRAGLDLEGKLLALAAASHSGEAFHVAGVREILAGAGLDEAALRCPPALPLDERALRQVLRDGGDADRVHMNCSGKHAAMLAACAAAHWPTESYLDPDHPLQREIRRTVEDLSGEPVAAVGVDGCGAPLFALSLTGLARAFRTMVRAEPGAAQRRVADAMRAYPDWTSGTSRPESALMEAVPGLLLKSGAEGVMAFALARWARGRDQDRGWRGPRPARDDRRAAAVARSGRRGRGRRRGPGPDRQRPCAGGRPGGRAHPPDPAHRFEGRS